MILAKICRKITKLPIQHQLVEEPPQLYGQPVTVKFPVMMKILAQSALAIPTIAVFAATLDTTDRVDHLTTVTLLVQLDNNYSKQEVHQRQLQKLQQPLNQQRQPSQLAQNKTFVPLILAITTLATSAAIINLTALTIKLIWTHAISNVIQLPLITIQPTHHPLKLGRLRRPIQQQLYQPWMILASRITLAPVIHAIRNLASFAVTVTRAMSVHRRLLTFATTAARP